MKYANKDITKDFHKKSHILLYYFYSSISNTNYTQFYIDQNYYKNKSLIDF